MASYSYIILLYVVHEYRVYAMKTMANNNKSWVFVIKNEAPNSHKCRIRVYGYMSVYMGMKNTKKNIKPIQFLRPRSVFERNWKPPPPTTTIRSMISDRDDVCLSLFSVHFADGIYIPQKEKMNPSSFWKPILLIQYYWSIIWLQNSIVWN